MLEIGCSQNSRQAQREKLPCHAMRACLESIAGGLKSSLGATQSVMRCLPSSNLTMIAADLQTTASD